MKQRIDYLSIAPDAVKTMLALENYVRQSGLDRALLDLVKIRVSQINGCAYCIHMHGNEACAHGETEERLRLLSAWRESPLFTDRERAALAWAEAVTLVAQTHVPDSVFEEVCRHFSEEEIVTLTVATASMNGLNRLAISMRAIHPVKSDGADQEPPSRAEAAQGTDLAMP